jgi:thermostable 8-oxoguanine DNA glycosylase
MFFLYSSLVYCVTSTAVKADDGRIFTQCMSDGFDVKNAELKEVCKSVRNIIDQQTKDTQT